MRDATRGGHFVSKWHPFELSGHGATVNNSSTHKGEHRLSEHRGGAPQRSSQWHKNTCNGLTENLHAVTDVSPAQLESLC